MHALMPISRHDPERAERQPAMFVDTGVRHVLGRLYRLGVTPERLVVKAAGGSRVFAGEGAYSIGKQNRDILRMILAKNGIRLAGTDFGVDAPRTLRLEIASGRTTVTIANVVSEL